MAFIERLIEQIVVKKAVEKVLRKWNGKAKCQGKG
jgi:hypothetical protein